MRLRFVIKTAFILKIHLTYTLFNDLVDSNEHISAIIQRVCDIDIEYCIFL